MTGSLVVVPYGATRNRFDRFALVGQDEVRFCDRRKLGGVWLASDSVAIDAIIGPQGPDARTVSIAELAARIATRRAIKPVLMDQRRIAGIGNMLSDEVLWSAGISPTRSATTLDADDLARLHFSMRDVLRRSVRAGHIPRTSSWLASQRTADQPVCPRCGSRHEQHTISARTSLSCPTCQR